MLKDMSSNQYIYRINFQRSQYNFLLIDQNDPSNYSSVELVGYEAAF